MNTGAEGGNFIKKTAKAHKKKEPGQNTKSLTPFGAYGDLEWTKGGRCDKIHEAKDRKEHTRMDNVIFIGMPAVGKSTVGVVVAKRLGYRFLDVDILIQETEGKLLREIIRENGIGGFLEIEDRINAGVRAEHSVISPGGSVVYCKNAMEHYKEIGSIVYLQYTKIGRAHV